MILCGRKCGRKSERKRDPLFEEVTKEGLPLFVKSGAKTFL